MAKLTEKQRADAAVTMSMLVDKVGMSLETAALATTDLMIASFQQGIDMIKDAGKVCILEEQVNDLSNQVLALMADQSGDVMVDLMVLLDAMHQVLAQYIEST